MLQMATRKDLQATQEQFKLHLSFAWEMKRRAYKTMQWKQILQLTTYWRTSMQQVAVAH
jgi:hypothetical protein